MTAPSRIPHGEAVRNAVRVEWMRLDDHDAMRQAYAWLEAHGVAAWLGPTPFAPDELLMWTERGPSLPARLGQVLAFVPESGEFSVWEWQRFVEAHPGVEG